MLVSDCQSWKNLAKGPNSWKSEIKCGRRAQCSGWNDRCFEAHFPESAPLAKFHDCPAKSPAKSASFVNHLSSGIGYLIFALQLPGQSRPNKCGQAKIAGPNGCLWYPSQIQEPFQLFTGWWFEPLWKIWKSIGMMKFPIYGKIKNGNQTTNQSTIQVLSRKTLSRGRLDSSRKVVQIPFHVILHRDRRRRNLLGWGQDLGSWGFLNVPCGKSNNNPLPKSLLITWWFIPLSKWVITLVISGHCPHLYHL